MKRALSSLLVFALVLTLLVPAFAFAADKTTEEKFNELKEKGLLNGVEDGSAALDRELTRAELAAILVRLFKLEPITGQSSFIDVPENHWAQKEGVIEAVAKAGLMGSTTTYSKTFSPDAKLTIAEVATVTVRALKLTVDENAKIDGVQPWAAPYVDAALKAQVIKEAKDYHANANRGILVDAAYVIYHTILNPVTDATKVDSVSATNLKEVVVNFDGTVDEETATDKANYSLKSGKTIKFVTLSEDKKSVTITLEGALVNNKADAVSVSGVKAGDNVVSVKNFEFTAADNAIPAVTEVKSLGTKSVKVTFTEPVKDLQQGNFLIDGKSFWGKITPSATARSAVLTPYNSSTLTVGEHTLTVSGVKDFANFVSLNSTNNFTVVEDKEAPTIVEATATLEKVTLTFSEEIDSETVKSTNVYWKSGTSKKTAYDFAPLAGNKYEFYFSVTNALPTGPVSIFVEGVKDYSGNEIAKDTSVTVTPVIDVTRPEVKKAEVVESNQIKVTFSKPMLDTSVSDVKNYTVLDKDDKVISVQSAALDANDAKIVYITLYRDLSIGNNTLTIKNLKDATKLQNTMLDYSATVVRPDKNAPYIDSTVVNKNDLRVVIQFSKKMNVETLGNYSNYLVKIDNSTQVLKNDFADISVFNDGTAVTISFAESINGKPVQFATGTTSGKVNISELHVLGVTDTNGNALKEFTEASGDNVIDLVTGTTFGLADYNSRYPGKHAALIDETTVKVKFNAGVINASSGAFSAKDGSGNEMVKSVAINGTSIVTVTLNTELETDGNGLNLEIDLSKLVTIAGDIAGTGKVYVQYGVNLLDQVAPYITNSGAYPVSVSGSETIIITYSEPLTQTTSNTGLRASDFQVTRISDNTVLDPATDYDVVVGGSRSNEIHITLKDTNSRSKETAYRIVVKDAKYTTDLAGNAIEDSSGDSVRISAVSVPSTVALVKGTNPGTTKLTGVDNTMEYSTDNGANWTPITGTSVDNISVDIGDEILVRVPGKLARTLTVTANVIKPDVAPAVSLAQGTTVGYTTLSGADNTMEYSVNNGAYQAITATNPEIDVKIDDVIKVRVKANAQQPASDEKVLTVTAGVIKPAAAPTGVALQPGTDLGTTKLTGVDATMEYQVVSGSTATEWTPIAGTDVDNISVQANDVINVRVKAANGKPAGQPQQITVQADDINS